MLWEVKPIRERILLTARCPITTLGALIAELAFETKRK